MSNSTIIFYYVFIYYYKVAANMDGFNLLLSNFHICCSASTYKLVLHAFTVHYKVSSKQGGIWPCGYQGLIQILANFLQIEYTYSSFKHTDVYTYTSTYLCMSIDIQLGIGSLQKLMLMTTVGIHKNLTLYNLYQNINSKELLLICIIMNEKAV